MIGSFDVDHVYTWVNSGDPTVEENRRRYAVSEVTEDIEYRTGSARIADNGELYASLQSARAFLPFVRNTYIFGSGAAPSWLGEFGDRVIYVPQNSVIPAPIWPTFQSDVVESFIHEIPGLSEHYIYSNDDFFFSKLHSVDDFFETSGATKVGLARYFAANGPTKIYRHIEENGVRALKRHVKLPGFYKSFPPLREGLRLRGRKNLLKARLQMSKRGLPLVNAIAHVSQAYRRSVWAGFHREFSVELASLYNERFRSKNGFGVNFAYHYYARSVGECVFHLASNAGVVERQHGVQVWEEFRSRLLSESSSITRFCLNDNPVEDEDGWADFVESLAKDLRTRRNMAPPRSGSEVRIERAPASSVGKGL